MQEFILSNGVNIPAVGYGSYLSTEREGKKVIKDALDAGYRYIDTARMYQNEAEIGEALSEYGIERESLFICSKVWPTMLSKEGIRESFEGSLKDLKTDYLDMYLIHWPKADPKDETWLDKVLEAWEVIEKLYDEKKIRAIGVSNFLPHHLKPMLEKVRIKPMVDQLELHVGYMQEYTLSYLKENGILPQAWSPLGRGKSLAHPLLEELANKYGRTVAQIILRWEVQHDIVPLPKSVNEDRIIQNANVFDFELSDDDMTAIDEIPPYGNSGHSPDQP